MFTPVSSAWELTGDLCRGLPHWARKDSRTRWRCRGCSRFSWWKRNACWRGRPGRWKCKSGDRAWRKPVVRPGSGLGPGPWLRAWLQDPGPASLPRGPKPTYRSRKRCSKTLPENIYEWILIEKTRQKGLQNTLPSDVIIALASVYCYCLHSTKLLLRRTIRSCGSVVNYLRRAVRKWIQWPYLSNKAMIDSTSCFSFSHWKKYWYSIRIKNIFQKA